jgi:hypothetical protein
MEDKEDEEDEEFLVTSILVFPPVVVLEKLEIRRGANDGYNSRGG